MAVVSRLAVGVLLAHSPARAFRLPAQATSFGSALSAAEKAFLAGDVPEARLSAEYLLAHAAGLRERSGLFRLGGEPLPEAVRGPFEEMCLQRLRRTPVQYIVGDWDFHELTLRLSPPVLIPRPETEELVELVLASTRGPAAAAAAAGRDFRILDVGCGSGAIGLALLRQLPNAECVGLDVSTEAIALSRLNARELGLSSRYEAVLEPLGIAALARRSPPEPTAAAAGVARRFDVLVSNAPYIPSADMLSLPPEVRRFEDERALCGGQDGLDVIRDVLRAAPLLLRPGGTRGIWLEVDVSHPPLLREWLHEPGARGLGVGMVRWILDLSGRPRFCELQWDGEGGGDGSRVC